MQQADHISLWTSQALIFTKCGIHDAAIRSMSKKPNTMANLMCDHIPMIPTRTITADLNFSVDLDITRYDGAKGSAIESRIPAPII
jgi:hypothetical protein